MFLISLFLIKKECSWIHAFSVELNIIILLDFWSGLEWSDWIGVLDFALFAVSFDFKNFNILMSKVTPISFLFEAVCYKKLWRDLGDCLESSGTFLHI